MRLHSIDTGAGDRVALLLHGLGGSAESWEPVTERLVRCGYRVIAPDLPGHGLSPRDAYSSANKAAEAVIAAVAHAGIGHLSVAMGHSYGGSVLAASVHRLRPVTSVYVDAGLTIPGGQDRSRLIAEYAQDRAARTADWFRIHRPFRTPAMIATEMRATERFDPASGASVSCGPAQSWEIQPGSIMVRAHPSRWVSDDLAGHLRRRGVSVREIDGAEHTIWYSHLDEFVGALPEVFTPTSAQLHLDDVCAESVSFLRRSIDTGFARRPRHHGRFE